MELIAREGGIDLLKVNPGLVIWTFVVFGVVLFLLHRFAWGPIARALDARADRVHNDIDRAQKLKEEAEQKLGDYLAKLEGLKAEGQQLMAASQKQAEEQKERLLAASKAEAQIILERSKREVLDAKEQALHDLHQQIVECAVAIAAQILERQLNPADHKKLALDTLDSIQKLQA